MTMSLLYNIVIVVDITAAELSLSIGSVEMSCSSFSGPCFLVLHFQVPPSSASDICSCIFTLAFYVVSSFFGPSFSGHPFSVDP